MSTISDIKERVDIVSLVSEHVQLTKAGKNYKGLCPFHSEKHGSFFVFPDRQTWHCFGACGVGGDIFSFVMKRENVDFREALEILARRAGVTLERAPARVPERDAKTERLLETLEAATSYFRRLLLDAEAGRKAREYLGKRHIEPEGEAGTSFRLGYSPDGWTNLKEHRRQVVSPSWTCWTRVCWCSGRTEARTTGSATVSSSRYSTRRSESSVSEAGPSATFSRST